MSNKRDKEGIYKITCKENGKIYIGRSINIDERLKSHKRSLVAGRHINKKLQTDFNEYGEDAFVFEVEKYTGVPLDTLYYESYYAEKYDVFNNGYNKGKLSKSESIKKVIDNLDYYVKKFTELTDKIPSDTYCHRIFAINDKAEDFFGLNKYDIGVMTSIISSYVGLRYGLSLEMNIDRTEIYFTQIDTKSLSMDLNIFLLK